MIGASTEATDSTFDLFIAIPASTQNNTPLTGTYYAADFELTNASTAQVRDSMVTLTLLTDGAGNISGGTATGHAANLNSGAIMPQPVSSGSYSVPGSTLTISGNATLLSGATRHTRRFQFGQCVSGRDSGRARYSDRGEGFRRNRLEEYCSLLTSCSFWFGGLRVDATGSSESFAGSGETINGDLDHT